jgi:hypothetical protein
MVMVVVMMVVVAMMGRVCQRDVRQKNQPEREAKKLCHDSIPNPWICEWTRRIA